MELFGPVLLVLLVLWVLLLTGWVLPLLISLLMRRRKGLARALRVITGIWLLVALVTGVVSFRFARSEIASIPRPISAGELAPFSDMHRVDRERIGLTPIDSSADIKLERHDRRSAKRYGYDAMLHMYGRNASRTVSFVLENGKYKWIGEQEIHYSGRRYTTPDGEVGEMIVISYSTRELSGTPRGYHIDYEGEDKALSRDDLTLREVLPIIREWDARSGTGVGQTPFRP